MDCSTTGWYVYLEASSYTGGESLTLESQPLTPHSDPGQHTTLTFYHNMFGSDVSTLRVWLVTDTSSLKVWEITGSQGPGWRQGCVQIPSQSTHYKVGLFIF